MRYSSKDTMTPQLTVLSYGGGQDSATILHRIDSDRKFRQTYAPKRLLIILSGTGNEPPDTAAYVEYTEDLCRRRGLEFVHLTPDFGFHRGNWQSLQHFYKAKTTCGSKAYPKSCTDALKISVIYRFLETWLGREYGMPVGRKQGIRAFAARYGPIRVLLGIAAGEEKRIGAPTGGTDWMSTCLERRYPLIELRWDRGACQAYLRAIGRPVHPPSNCVYCPFKSEIEILWTARRYPAAFAEWVAIEAAKLAKHAALGDRNLGVFGRRTLPEVLATAERTYAHLADADLDAYRFSHGHGVCSIY